MHPRGNDPTYSCASQTITLPSRRFTALLLLATPINGSRNNQTFTVTYTDNWTAGLAQDPGDWCSPRERASRSATVATGHRLLGPSRTKPGANL